VSDPGIERAWAPNPQARPDRGFSRLVALNQQGLRAFLRRLCANHALADDLAQETFVSAWQSLHRFDATKDFRSWLFGIGWRKYREQKRSWLRRIKREQKAAPEDESFMPDPGMSIDLAAAVRALPLEQRAALLLCLACEFSHAEAARILEIPLGTVKSHVARARERLQAALGESDA
jgi:RNA polymerase sigma-70 factor (ECF subfamily)